MSTNSILDHLSAEEYSSIVLNAKAVWQQYVYLLKYLVATYASNDGEKHFPFITNVATRGCLKEKFGKVPAFSDGIYLSLVGVMANLERFAARRGCLIQPWSGLPAYRSMYTPSAPALYFTFRKGPRKGEVLYDVYSPDHQDPIADDIFVARINTPRWCRIFYKIAIYRTFYLLPEIPIPHYEDHVISISDGVNIVLNEESEVDNLPSFRDVARPLLEYEAESLRKFAKMKQEEYRRMCLESMASQNIVGLNDEWVSLEELLETAIAIMHGEGRELVTPVFCSKETLRQLLKRNAIMPERRLNNGHYRNYYDRNASISLVTEWATNRKNY